MTYIFFGSAEEYVERVDATNGQLDEIAPPYFDLNKDGTLKNFAVNEDEELKLTDPSASNFIEKMHERGVRVVPFMSNHWEQDRGRKALARREQLAEEVAAAVRDNELDGVNVDIENLTEADRAGYTDFVRLLREKLPEECTLSVAVAANPTGKTTGWQGSYDYRALAENSDYLMIMAYDESYNGSPPGPVASYCFVENSIKYALGRVSPDKVVLGIPFYGRYWLGEEGGYGIGSVYVEDLIEKYGGTVRFVNTSKTPVADVTIPYGGSFSIGHESLGQGKYTIWYENEDSIKYKLGLVQKYNLKGTGSWSLGHETDGTWDYYGLWLGGQYFADIQKHWARDFILTVQEKGWMLGTGGAIFSPDLSMTRAQAAVVLVRMLGLESTGETDMFFSDIQGHWAEKEIEIAAEHGMVEGTSVGCFSPDRELTRQQMAVMLDRIFAVDSENFESRYFRDVNAQELTWSYSAITRMGGVGVFNGYPDKTFRPYKEMSRAQMAVLLERLWTLMHEEVLQTE